jgi:hypothetical protein
MHELKKGKEKLSRLEKRSLYGGNKTILYEKLGILDESDLEKYRKKMGIKKDVDLTEGDVNEILEKNMGESQKTKGKKMSRLRLAKKELEKEEFKKIVLEYRAE